MKRTVVIYSVAVLVVAVAAYFVFFAGSTKKYDFRLDKVQQGDLNVNVTTTGTVNAVVSVDVGTQVSGIISNLYADFNSVVREGQVIARIDTTFLWQSVKDAEAAVAGAEAKAADSHRTLVREKALLERQLDSQANYDAALTADETNHASLLQAKAALDRAKINLSYATIRAPVSGVVINRAVNVGQTVAASFSSPLLYTIANDLSKMQVLTTVDESDIGMISIGQTSTFTVDAYPDRKFLGTVSQIRLAPVSIQNVVNYTVVIDVDNSDLKLMPGMTANVNVGVASAHNVLKVPNLALRFQPPADLVDSAKLLAMRESFAGRGMRDAGAPGATADPAGTAPGANNSAAGGGQSGGEASRPGGLKNVGAIRDSILAAHGGQMSPEDLRAEMGKVFERLRAPQKPQKSTPLARHIAPPPTGSTTYGITNIYPQFERVPYEPQHQAGRARVWILNAQKKLEPVFVRTGVTDGRFTEVTTDSLKPGDQVVLGATSTSDNGSSANPLAGGGQRGPGGPGGFR